MYKRSRSDDLMSDPTTPVIFIVDDDRLMGATLLRLFTNAGMAAEFYASGAEFLARAKLDRHACLLLDVSMPDMSGLEVQARLHHLRVSLPVIFLTGSSCIATAVAAMREGAVDFIEKPFDNDDLVERVRRAIALDGHQRSDEGDKQGVLQRLKTLTPRECRVMELVVAGRTSKEIARVLDSSHRTIDIHRAHLMEKMSASTLAALVRMRLLVDDGQSWHSWNCNQIKSPKNVASMQSGISDVSHVPKQLP